MYDVVVTGIGLVTPLGIGTGRTWDALIRGESAVRPDPSFAPYHTARVRDLPVPAQTRLLSMGFMAVAEALQDCGLDRASVDPERIGCTVSVSKPDLFNRQQFLEACLSSALGRQLARVFMLQGPSRNIAAACATGTNAVIVGAEWIRRGLCDVVIAGAAESSIHPLYVAGFGSMGVLGRGPLRPFDRDRDGFAMGEGAAVLVLERRDHAGLRGAQSYGEVSGWAMANDNASGYAFRPDGSTIAAAMSRALENGRTAAVDYLNAHGTATRLNDAIETRAIKAAFGPAASRVAISSTKGATGHMLGATGAAEIAFSLLALKYGVVPPTVNLEHSDPECDLDYTPGTARFRPLASAMSVSFGFGGQIGAVVLKKI